MKTTPTVGHYNHIDHYHCWTDDKPPCGQRIEHLKCCLCEKLNPKVYQALRTELLERLEGRKSKTGFIQHFHDINVKNCSCPDLHAVRNDELDEAQTIIREVIPEI